MTTAESSEESDEMQRCASCGIAAGDDIKLKKCTACHLVRYCGVKCQRDHRPQHKRECKKRAAELKDEILFKQPQGTHDGDCPICCLPLSIDLQKATTYTCCNKRICLGCERANKMREEERRLQYRCPFCREPVPSTVEENIKQLMTRTGANDPGAMCRVGMMRCQEGDYKSAFEYWTKAASLGGVEAHYQLSVTYRLGLFVAKDEKKEIQHLTVAAIAGHPLARHNLGTSEWRNGRKERAVKHWIIGAKLGYDPSMECVKKGHQDGFVSKEDFDAAHRGHEAAIAATKSPQREAAAGDLGWRCRAY